MKTLARILPILALLAAGLACGLPAAATPPTAAPTVPAADTVAPPPTEAVAPTVTAAPAGDAYSFPPIDFVLPHGLANRADPRTTTETSEDGNDMVAPYVNPSGGIPPHTKITLGDYMLQGGAYLAVFRADQFAANGDFEAQIIADLKTLSASSGATIPDGLLIGPFDAQVQAVKFKNGVGVRYLAQFNNGMAPIDNADIFYYFLGLSNDGTQFVEAVLPVNAAFLALNGSQNSPVPADGIQFPPYANPGANVPIEDIQKYYQSVKDKLNATPAEAFTPSLAVLDQLIQSITLSANP